MTEKKVCQNCKKDFTIESGDLIFYEKMKVPAPTFCPDCRRQRRGTWRNERTLYKRDCDLCHKPTVGLYPAGTSFPVYCNDCWFSDRWDPLSYGREYDLSKSFFEQFKELSAVMPRAAIWVKQGINSEYTNQSYYNKNVYLSFAIRDSEDVQYACRDVEVKQSTDVCYTHHSERLYQTVDTDKSYRSRFLIETEGCVDSGFLADSRNCQQCFGGVNLRSGKNIFFGKQFSKEQYEAEISKLKLGSRQTQSELVQRFKVLQRSSIYKFANLINTTNVLGDHVFNSKNCYYSFDGFELENTRYTSWVFTSKEVMDCYGMGESEYVYEGIGIEHVNNLKFCSMTNNSSFCEYSDLCSSSNNLFGCVSLTKKEYCILNKQYTKEEYIDLASKIREQMNSMPYSDRNGLVYKYGEFFPTEISPFAYNETVAQENFPLSKEEILKKGFVWREPEDKNYIPTKDPTELPDDVNDADESIIKEIIRCEHKGICNHQCSTVFRIIQPEFQFYKNMNIPLPTLCPNCRFYKRLDQRNPLKLYSRRCQCAGLASENGNYKNNVKHEHGEAPCGNQFQTTYAPDRPESVYCESCYNAEIV